MSAIPLCEVGRRGRLHLRVGSRDGETVLSENYCEVPFKITRLQKWNGLTHLILMQSTAGLFGGDAIECDIHVESGARILITQQAATKVHPSEGRLATQTNRVRVDSGAVLYLYNEPLIPFSRARLKQTTSIELENGSRFYFWESFMAGRIARGEVWQFDELASETSLRVDGRLRFLDRFHLVPRERSPVTRWTMGNAHYLATALCYDPRASEITDRLHQLLPQAGIDTPAPGLLALRVASANGLDYHQSRDAFTTQIDTLWEPQRCRDLKP